MSTVLTRDEVRAIVDTKIEWVPVPEWGEGKGVFVQGLTGTGRDSFEMAMIEQRGKKQEINVRNLRAKLVVRCAVDSDDPKVAKPIFRQDDILWLGEKSASALQRIYAVAQRLSGLSREDVEELTIALGEDQSGASGTDSPLQLESPTSNSSNEASPAANSPSGWPMTDSNPSETDD